MSRFQALLCDDVRVEDTGKFIAIGAYTEAFQVPSFPIEIFVSLLLVVSEVRPGPNVLKIAVKSDRDDVDGLVKTFPFEATENGRATLRFYAVELTADAPMMIEIHCAIEGEDLRVIEALPVFAGEQQIESNA